jgi:hypothetical protein
MCYRTGRTLKPAPIQVEMTIPQIEMLIHCIAEAATAFNSAVLAALNSGARDDAAAREQKFND